MAQQAANRVVHACARRSRRWPTTTIVPITAARITVGVAPTNKVYTQMQIRIAQNALRRASRKPSVRRYNAAPMIVIFQPLITRMCEVPVAEKLALTSDGIADC